MQSWSNQGQNDANGHSSWQGEYNFAGQNNQFEQDQAWSQSLSGQTYARSMNPADASPEFLHGSHTIIPNYEDNQGSFGLTQQFSGHDAIDTTFNNTQSNMYSQQNKMGLGGDEMHHLTQTQGHPQTHSQTFPNHDFNTFPQQTGQQYTSPVSQFSQPHGLPQNSQQQTHSPVQQFNNAQPGNFPQQVQPPPSQHQQQQQPRSQSQAQQYSQTHPQQAQSQHTFTGASFAAPQVNGQAAQYQTISGAPPNYAYSQPYGSPEQTSSYQQHGQVAPAQQFAQSVQRQTNPRIDQSNSISVSQGPPQHSISLELEHSARANNHGVGTARPQVVSSASHQSPISAGVSPVAADSAARKVEETDSLAAPVPTPQEAQVLLQFSKRTKAQQAKFPAIQGLPHLSHDGVIKIPAPKSYDKLAPLVALPPRTRRPIIPEMGYQLPCEIQGRFTSLYQPAANNIGLDERRIESKTILEDFDRSMKALGKRRPKYTEYPHAFKEQLKADEASKNKAAKSAKREMEETSNKPIRVQTRPTDPKEATAWDVIGIVNIEPSTSKTNTLVAQRVQQAGELFIKLRGEMNQAKLALDHATKEKHPESEISRLKREAELRKEILYRAFDATIEHADDAVMDNLAGHQKLILSLVNVLISSIKSGDFSGKLPKIVLELFTHFPMSKKIAETTNFELVRKRFADKGDDEVKEFVRDISVKIRKIEGSTGYTGTSAASRAKAVTSATKSSGAPGTSVKRGRDEDGGLEPRTVKKVAVEPGSSSLMRKLGQPKLQLQSASKTTAAKAAAASIQMEKSRSAVKPAPKTDSRSNSPSISLDDKVKNDAKASTTKVDTPKTAPKESKPPVPKNASSSSTSTGVSGIGSLLASITAPKPEPSTSQKRSEEPDLNETPTEKAKRLRKEARRKLRVTWKPESELVQVKIIEKEDSEDEGRDINMIRDAADDRAEGMMLKQAMDIDDDDDDDIPYQPWESPVVTDFSGIPQDVRMKNFITRGGSVTFTTAEQSLIAQREQRELMAIYTDSADIPPTPKSPPPEQSPAANPKIGYLPQESNFEEIQLRWRDEQHMGVDGAFYTATQRLNARPKSSKDLGSNLSCGSVAKTPTQGQPSQTITQLVDGDSDVNVPLVMGLAIAENVLSWLTSDRTKRWIDPAPSMSDPSRLYNYNTPGLQIVGRYIEKLAQDLAGKPFPATSPPDWLAKDEERIREWWLVYNKEAAARQRRDDEQRARAEAQTNPIMAAAAAATMAGPGQNPSVDWNTAWAQHSQQQQQAYAPYMAILQQMGNGHAHNVSSQTQQTSQPSNSEIQDLLAAMGQPQQTQQHQGSMQGIGASNFPNTSDPAYQQYMMLQQIAQAQYQQQTSSNEHERDGDRHDRYDRDDFNRDNRDHRGKNNNKTEKKKAGPTTIHKPPNAALIGTKPCTFWQQGKCARGDKCTFRHD